jgi:hypothetical protein
VFVLLFGLACPFGGSSKFFRMLICPARIQKGAYSTTLATDFPISLAQKKTTFYLCTRLDKWRGSSAG